ncbi:molybdate ABC transporter substrate-binding protein [Thetidibacter halocola]|uniref:Molybdate ABC transporter substrate-binding protein n=1 Tax=Thetidibacter halocola TaxID=2827239 RepID=A0A8J7WE12_9RHOB|nr:molybdate ABC transporter substrate-binding protein [Thetidibacter halocola]MBS0123474.1 molybdate ABC transporter substrate-binding protein [Thetidibacter halocola]
MIRVLSLICLLFTPVALRAEGPTVFAASSLKTALDLIAEDYGAATGQTVTLSYAGTSALARQIQFGAPADLYISANAEWMDVLQEQALILPESRVDLLGNRLVLIGPAGAAPIDMAAPLPQGRIAMALVEAVPAGIYGKAALESLGLWDAAEPNVVQTDNVRAALALVALGEAQLGVVYASDAVAEPRVTVLAEFPADSHPPIVYPAAIVAPGKPEARAFLDHLAGPQARAVFDAQGFLPLTD